MSFIRLSDTPTGLAVDFDDVQGVADSTGHVNFHEVQVASGLNRAKPHTVKLTMAFVDGPSNDVVKVFVDGELVHTGTSWENYYRFDSEASAEQTPRLIRTVLFRASGSTTPTVLGHGFLIDHLSYASRSPRDGHDKDSNDNDSSDNDSSDNT